MKDRVSSGGTWGRYRLGERIGIGGMAEVFRAVSPGAAGFEKPVVIKRILPEYAEDRSFVSMFVNEARIGATLAHPNIVQIYDFGEVDGDYFMAMEYVHGTDVARLLWRLLQRKRTLPQHLVAFVAVDVLRALEFAHNRLGSDGRPSPVIHRDVSPQNILVSLDGLVKLTDFGLARALDHTRLTRPGTLKGKLSYMSPEQAFGRDVDARSDLFSLGIVMYELLVGKSLFRGGSDADTLARVRAAAVPLFERFVPGLSEQFAATLRRALAREPADRFSTAAEFRRSLLEYLRTVDPPVEATTLGALVREVIESTTKPPEATADATEIGGNVVVDPTEPPTAILDPDRDAGSAPDGPWIEGPQALAMPSQIDSDVVLLDRPRSVAGQAGAPSGRSSSGVEPAVIVEQSPVVVVGVRASSSPPAPKVIVQPPVPSRPIHVPPRIVTAEPPTLMDPAAAEIPVTPPHGSPRLDRGLIAPEGPGQRDSDKVTVLHPGAALPVGIVPTTAPADKGAADAALAHGPPDSAARQPEIARAPGRAGGDEAAVSLPPRPPMHGPGILGLLLIGLGLLVASALVTWVIVSN
ncbi:MAG: protein kinase [Deltaproteobacteria bacterium]|nr:protein kinase [Deltaproteobacteria bacterium]